jgi:hypothetical protein
MLIYERSFEGDLIATFVLKKKKKEEKLKSTPP